MLVAPLIATLALPRSALGSPPLAIHAPAECPGAHAVEQAVSAHVGRAVPLAGVSVTIAREAASWHARLQTPDGERELEAETCDAAIEAVALVLALAADAEARVPPTGPVPSAPSPPGARDALPGAASGHASTSDTAPGAPPPEVALGLTAGVLGEVGLLPAPSLGARLGLDATFRAWRLELAGMALLPRRGELGSSGDVAADIGWCAAELTLCRHLAGELEACASAELGQLRGEGAGVDAPQAARGTWFAWAPSAVWSAPWATPPGRWSWRLGAGAALAVVRPEFGFDGVGVLHRPSPVSGRVWLALGWR